MSDDTEPTSPMPIDEHEEEEKPEWENITDDGGVMKKILNEGSGWERPKKGYEVDVHYVGRLYPDGSVFDSSRDRNEAFTFKLGANQVIQGWERGVKSMKKGERCLLRIKPEYAYGANGAGDKIPPNAILDFEIELLSWMAEAKITSDGGVLKRTLHEGDGWDKPKAASSVEISISARVKQSDQPFFQSNSFTFIIGEEQTVEGIEKAVESMKKGEKAEITLQPAYTRSPPPPITTGSPPCGFDQYGVTANDTVVAIIELLNFTKPKEPWAMSGTERIESATLNKDEGNEFFKHSRYSMALKRYQRSLDCIAHANFTEEEKTQSNKIAVAAHLNLAMVYIKQSPSNWSEVLTNCNKALEIEHQNVKALYRRALALTELSEFDSAKRDLDIVLRLDPSNAEAKRAMATLTKRMQAQDAKDRTLYSRMFA